MSVLSLHLVSKTYKPGLFKKKVAAVRDLELEIREGEVFGLIGPNGAGKSSTIRMILGVSRPDSGTILFRGKPLGQSEFRREIGYLPENPYLYDHVSLEELLLFCGRTSGLATAEIKTRGRALMERLDLLEAARRPLRTYSKGMLQRAGICFALLHDPAIAILDEPMSGLDPIGRKMVFDLVLELRREGKTVFFCSHILSDVERLCDRIGVMVKGRLVRVLEQRDFLEVSERSIHLLLPQLTEAQVKILQSFPFSLMPENGGTVLSVTPSGISHALEALGGMGIEIRGTRSECLSLEDLFIHTVKEAV